MSLTFIGTAEQLAEMEDLRTVFEHFFGTVNFVNVEDDADAEKGGTDHADDSK